MEMMQFDAVPVGTSEQENPCHLPMDKGYAQILRKISKIFFAIKCLLIDFALFEIP